MARTDKKLIIKRKIQNINSGKTKPIKPAVINNPEKLSKREKKNLKKTGAENITQKDYGMLFNSDELKNMESNKYIKRKNVDYDIIIISGSYNRYEMIENQLKQFFSQDSYYTFKYILINDGSDDERYDGLKEKYPEITYLKNKLPNGKFLYWSTITQLLNEAGKYNAHSILQIDDDFFLCKNYLNKIMDLFFLKKRENNKYFCISYHLYAKDHISQYRWNCPNGSWVDGGGLYDFTFFEKTGFKINEIPMSRWRKLKSKSTGVWEQVSRSIFNNNGTVYKTPVSYVNHEGLIWGSLERKDKNNNALNTYKFIDDE
jgi:hypothetical protein